jgi:hypothetical protein
MDPWLVVAVGHRHQLVAEVHCIHYDVSRQTSVFDMLLEADNTYPICLLLLTPDIFFKIYVEVAGVMSLQTVFQGLLEGGFAAVCFTYALQTRNMYPKKVLKALDEPWIICVVIIIALLLWSFSPKSAIFLLLLVIAFVIDMHIFTQDSLISVGSANPFQSIPVTRNDAMNMHGWYSANGDLHI